MKSYVPLSLALIGTFILGTIFMSYSNANNQVTDNHEQPRKNDRFEIDRYVAPTPVVLNDPQTEFSDSQEEDIRKILRSYLLDNPEILIEMSGVLQERQVLAEKENTKKNFTNLINERDGYTNAADRKNAKVAVIELFDYHCGYCKRASGLVQEIANSQKDVVVSFREYPILRPESQTAAIAALAARNQGKYLDFHFALMDTSGTLTEERIFDIARDQNIDVDKLQAVMNNPAIHDAVLTTRNIAESIGVSGTPAFIVASLEGDFLEVISGFSPDRVNTAIEAARAAN